MASLFIVSVGVYLDYGDENEKYKPHFIISCLTISFNLSCDLRVALPHFVTDQFTDEDFIKDENICFLIKDESGVFFDAYLWNDGYIYLSVSSDEIYGGKISSNFLKDVISGEVIKAIKCATKDELDGVRKLIDGTLSAYEITEYVDTPKELMLDDDYFIRRLKYCMAEYDKNQ